MRVSNNESYEKLIYNINLIQADMSKKQVQMSTGKSFQRISEEPLKANQSMLIRHSFDRVEQFQKNINDAKGFLELVETTFGSTISVIQDAREKGVLASSGTYSAADRKTFAENIEQAIQHVVGLSNTKFLGKYIFSGEKTQTETFTYNGTTAVYNGDTANIQFKTSNASDVQISETGDVAFQNTLDALIQLRDNILTGTSDDINNAVADLDVALNDTIDLRSEIGTRMNAVDTMNEIYENTKVNLETKKENVENIDYIQLITEFANVQRLYQGTIQAATLTRQTTILNYI